MSQLTGEDMHIASTRTLVAAASFLLACACGKSPVAPPDVRQLTLRFNGLTGRVSVLEVGDRLQVIAETRDSAGKLLSNTQVRLSSTTPQFFDVGQDGLIQAKAAGSGYLLGTVQAAATLVRDSLLVTVAVPVSARP
jgi:hypothetical protein